MKNFGSFLEDKVLERKIEECARIMAQADIDPEKFVVHFFESLDEDLNEAGFWSGLANKASDMWKRWSGAAGDFGAAVKAGASAGASRGKDRIAGPSVKFQKAVETLKGVSQFLKSNEKTAAMASQAEPQLKIHDYINKMIEMLNKEVLPVLSNPQVTQDWEVPGSGGASQQPVAQPGSGQQTSGAQSAGAGATGSIDAWKKGAWGAPASAPAKQSDSGVGSAAAMQRKRAQAAAQKMSGATFNARPEDSSLQRLRDKQRASTSEGTVR
jgi:hypothetical protein